MEQSAQVTGLQLHSSLGAVNGCIGQTIAGQVCYRVLMLHPHTHTFDVVHKTGTLCKVFVGQAAVPLSVLTVLHKTTRTAALQRWSSEQK